MAALSAEWGEIQPWGVVRNGMNGGYNAPFVDGNRRGRNRRGRNWRGRNGNLLRYGLAVRPLPLPTSRPLPTSALPNDRSVGRPRMRGRTRRRRRDSGGDAAIESAATMEGEPPPPPRKMILHRRQGVGAAAAAEEKEPPPPPSPVRDLQGSACQARDWSDLGTLSRKRSHSPGCWQAGR